ncbi:MAG: hypothetical protein IT354_06090 [Gemmatimonadaceae bacterium]|nr:hypothetical protein [Gemmatimonadaceae bacterium]
MSLARRHFLAVCLLGALFTLTSPHAAAAGRVPRYDDAELMVHNFLKRHLAGTRGFNATSVGEKSRYLTRRLRNNIFDFLRAVAKSPRDVPMVSDPFTGSMGATSYDIGKVKVRVEKAWVPVTFTDGTNRWTVTYLLRNDQERGDDRWRLDDIEDVRGMLLSKVLRDNRP